MRRIVFSILAYILWAALFALPLAAQQPPAEVPSPQQPQVKVNMLNVCTPSPEEQKEIASALARIPKQPLFGNDFEVSRGRSTLTDMPSFLPAGATAHVAGEPPIASYVRVRKEFSVQALFSRVQYSFSNDGQMMVETLVLHVRDPKDLIQVSLEDSASSVTSSEAMLGANTPVSRVRLGAFWQIVGRAGTMFGRRGRTCDRPDRIRAAVSQRVGSAGQLPQPARGQNDRAGGIGKDQRGGESESGHEAKSHPSKAGNTEAVRYLCIKS